MISLTDGWAVGYGGVICHWNGAYWSPVNSPTTANLKAVDMVNPEEGLAVAADIGGYGNNNSIIEYNGGRGRICLFRVFWTLCI
jgi:hypothetical protein